MVIFFSLWRFLWTSPLIFLFFGGLLGTFALPPVSLPLCWFFSLSILLSFLWKLFQNLEKNHAKALYFFLPTFRKTWFWFFGLHLGTLHWIANSLWTDPLSYGVFYIPVLFLVPTLLSFFGATSCGVTLVVLKIFHRHIVKVFLQKTQGQGVFFLEQYSLLILQIIFPFVFSFFYVAQEWIKGHGFFSFPWNLTAYIWSSHLSFAQGAYYLGSYGLGHVTLLLLCFFWLSLVFFQKEYGQKLPVFLTSFISNGEKYSYNSFSGTFLTIFSMKKKNQLSHGQKRYKAQKSTIETGSQKEGDIEK